MMQTETTNDGGAQTARDERSQFECSAWLGREWVEVDATCFNTSEGGVFKTTLLINRCKKMKRFTRRVRDAVTLESDTQDECDAAVAAYVEKPNVLLLSA